MSLNLLVISYSLAAAETMDLRSSPCNSLPQLSRCSSWVRCSIVWVLGNYVDPPISIQINSPRWIQQAYFLSPPFARLRLQLVTPIISPGTSFILAIINGGAEDGHSYVPRRLVKRREEDAACAVSLLTSLPPDHPEIQTEFCEISLSFQQEFGDSSCLERFRSSHNEARLRTSTGIFLLV